MPKKSGVELFAKIARKAHADRLTPFRQVTWLQQFEPEKAVEDLEGKCYAFAFAYLLSLRTSTSGEHLIQALEKAVEHGDEAIKREMFGGSTSMMDGWVGKDLYSLQFAPKDRNLAMGAFQLTPHGEEKFEQTFSRFAAVAQYASADAPLYSLILAPNHAMAATATPLWNRTAYTFFDPNFGEVVFNSQSRFKKFVTDFFSESLFNKAYRRRQVSELASGNTRKRQVAETKSLILRVQRFRETVS